MNRVTVGRNIIRLANGFVNLCVLGAILLLLAFGSYALWDSGQVHALASAQNYERFHPSMENETASFSDLQALNPDVFAWLTVYGTNIDYPVVQGQDNIRYINTDAKGNYSLSGAIFLDYRSGPNFSDFSSILYGHHMENEVMFGEIGSFSNKAYFDARRYGALYVGGQEHGLEFFAFVHADAYDHGVFRNGIVEPEARQAYLDMLLQLALHTRPDVSVTTNDRIVLLSTCSESSTNGRDILIGKITGERFPDPFETETTGNRQALPVVDGLAGLWTTLPLWAKIGAGTTALLLIVLAVVLLYTKRRRTGQETPDDIKSERGE